jgi:hypothetical protein
MRKKMNSRNDLIAEIEDGMGSEGDHDVAERMYIYMRNETDLIDYDQYEGLHFTREFEDNEFLEIWEKCQSA